jgi:hypothetical protein
MTTAKQRALREQVASTIEAHPDRWYQGDWATIYYGEIMEEDDSREYVKLSDIRASLDDVTGQVDPYACATTGCVAGWACFLGLPKTSKLALYKDVVVDRSGREFDISRKAEELLGLNAEQADWLFAGDRSLPAVLWALRNTGDWTTDDAYNEFYSE